MFQQKDKCLKTMACNFFRINFNAWIILILNIVSLLNYIEKKMCCSHMINFNGKINKRTVEFFKVKNTVHSK